MTAVFRRFSSYAEALQRATANASIDKPNAMSISSGKLIIPPQKNQVLYAVPDNHVDMTGSGTAFAVHESCCLMQARPFGQYVDLQRTIRQLLPHEW